MRPITKTVTGVGVSDWIPFDTYANPFNIGFGCVVTGTANYTVQHTFDDPASSPTAFDHPDIAAQTTSKDGNYAYPVRAIRLKINSGTGSVALTAIQGG